MRYLITLLLTYPIFGLYAQNGKEQFEKCYNEFKNARTLFINGSFKGFGKNAGSLIEAEGTIALQKEGLNISRYKSFAISEMAILEKINYEEVVFDGINVYSYNQEKGEFENKGSWEPSGKQYAGYSKILYGNLSSIYAEFEKNKEAIKLETNNDGYVLRLPYTEDRGQVLIYFKVDDLLPNKIIRYEQKSNDRDYVALTLTNLRYNVTFPAGFFESRNSSAAKKNTSNVASAPNSSAQKSNSALLAIGTPAPDWELLNSEGVKRKLSDFKGKIILLDFWAPWCAPCVQAQPMLQKIQEKYKKDIVVLGMDYNDNTGIDINGYKAKKKIGYEMILNAEKIGDFYNVIALPTAYLIDRSGHIIFSSLGYSEQDEHQLSLAIEKALK